MAIDASLKQTDRVTGCVLKIHGTFPNADVIVERSLSPSSGFEEVGYLYDVPSEGQTWHDQLPLDATPRYYRCKHVEPGHTSSSYTAVITATPNDLTEYLGKLPNGGASHAAFDPIKNRVNVAIDGSGNIIGALDGGVLIGGQTATAVAAGTVKANTAFDSGNNLVGNVHHNGTIAGRSAGLINRQTHGVFLEEWDTGMDGWQQVGGTGTGLIVNGPGQSGGNVYRATGQVWAAFTRNIPYDPTKLFRYQFRVRQVTAPTNGSQAHVYGGYVGVAADGVTLVNVFGLNEHSSQHYQAAVNVPITTAQGWRVFTGWTRGFGATTGGTTAAPDPTAPSNMHPAVRYIRPMFIVNYVEGNGVAEVDMISVDVFDDDGTYRTYAALNGGGNLNSNVRQYDGVYLKSIARGGQQDKCRHNVPVTFAQPFQNVPMMMFRGGVIHQPEDKWGTAAAADAYTANTFPNTSLAVHEDVAPLNLSVTGYVPRLRLRQLSSQTPQTYTFPAGTLTNVGEASESPALATAPASDDAYTVTFGIDVTVVTLGMTGEVSGQVVIAIDVDATGTGAWVERWTNSYSSYVEAPGDSSASNTESYPNEQATVTASGVTANGKARVRIKSITTNGSGVCSTVVDAGATTFNTSSGDLFTPKTPAATDFVQWQALEIAY